MFAVSDYPGHYFPMVPLGWAFQAAGHEVRVACGPAQVSTASRTGLPAVACGSDVDTVVQARIGYHLAARQGLMQHPGLPPLHPLTGAPMRRLEDFDWAAYEPEYVAQAAIRGRDRTRAMAGFARDWRPDLVVHDLLSPEGMVAAHVAGARSLCHLWGPTGTDETGYGLAALRPDVPAPVRERLGIALDADLLPEVVDPCPAAVAPATTSTRLPVRYLPFHGGGGTGPAVPAPPARPRICAVWSNSLSQIFGPASFVLPALVRACADLDVELVLALSTQDAELLGPLPPYARLLRHFPLSLLLPGCSVVVHHGGAGCLMTGLAAGVPQLALPFGAEQEMIATRLAAAGAGLVIRGSLADEASLTTALRRLLVEPAFLARATTLARANDAAPAPAELAAMLTVPAS